jgi:hypothetical protein
MHKKHMRDAFVELSACVSVSVVGSSAGLGGVGDGKTNLQRLSVIAWIEIKITPPKQGDGGGTGTSMSIRGPSKCTPESRSRFLGGGGFAPQPSSISIHR